MDKRMSLNLYIFHYTLMFCFYLGGNDYYLYILSEIHLHLF